MAEFLVGVFKENVWLAILFVSMIPTLESKVAIPMGVAVEIWGDNALSLFVSFILGFFGTLLPAFFLFLIVRLIKSKMVGFVCGGKFVALLKKIAMKKVERFGKKTTTKKLLSLILFVSLPIPLTGAFSGVLIAGVSSLNPIKSFLSICIGHLISCLIVLLVCFVFNDSAFYIFVISVCLILMYVAINLVLFMIEKIKKRKEI